jgi:quinol monooxygenase YgiN
MAGPWRNQDQWDEIRDSDGFKESMQALSAILDSFEVSSYELAGQVS